MFESGSFFGLVLPGALRDCIVLFVPAAQSLALSILYGLITMPMALLGGLLWFGLPDRRVAQDAPLPEAESELS